MDANQGSAAPPPPAVPCDLSVERSIGERTPEHQLFVYSEAFNNSVRLAFVRDFAINVTEGTKNPQPTNMERVRLLNDRAAPQVREAPREYHLPGQL